MRSAAVGRTTSHLRSHTKPETFTQSERVTPEKPAEVPVRSVVPPDPKPTPPAPLADAPVKKLLAPPKMPPAKSNMPILVLVAIAAVLVIAGVSVSSSAEQQPRKRHRM